ncbi:transposon Ty3-I Gag-Pol polyprotein [Trichonephila clavipes]|nr:transposon Ty3-I Gag-Pol polyprotein [Trichonephila clavipes]
MKLKLLSNSSKNEEFRFIDGILCRKNFDPDGKLWLPVIPKHLRRADILRHFHDARTAGHLGFAKNFMTDSQEILLAGNVPKCRSVCHALSECQRRKSVPQRPPGRLVPIPPVIRPFHRIELISLGRFQKVCSWKQMDNSLHGYSTRYATKSLPTAEVDEIAKFYLKKLSLRHGAPRVIITEIVEPSLRSRLVSLSSTCVTLIIVYTTAYHPQTNGTDGLQ